ncbi:MAG: porin family protein [Bacteroidales bacterium]|nr:porin family protein [Bacteroidales bacterium]
MKKIAFIFLAALLIGNFQAIAQIGGKIGYNFAKQSGQETPGMSEKSLNNVMFGVFLDKDLIPLLDLRVGLEYSPKGTRFELDDLYIQGTYSYLEIPVQAKIKLGPVYALGGVYGAYALKGKSENNLLGVVVETDVDFDNAEMKRFDYGMKFGAGFQLGLGPLHAFAQVEYGIGLQNLNKGDGDAIKNNVLTGSVGVILGF